MKTDEINIRDPYIMVQDGMYYMYGTRSETCWGMAEGFDCYKSCDMENWTGPIEIFKRPQNFFATENFWAPECYFYKGDYYLLTTFGAEDRKKGIYFLRSKLPEGPFELYGGRLTPETWSCIDGTLYFGDEGIFMIFSHSFEDSPKGEMCILELTEDLSGVQGKPELLFEASEASWAKPVPFAKIEFGMDGDVYFTDGPCVFKMNDGRLAMTWSSWGTAGYAVGVAISENGSIKGPWKQREKPIWPENGGHGMVFRDEAGQNFFVLHYPNDKTKERPCIRRLIEKEGELFLKEGK